METLQRSVMLLKPDAHVPGRWDSGATLRLSAVPGGVALSFKPDDRDQESGTLTLFMKNGSAFAAVEVHTEPLEAKLSGIRLADVAGAAVVSGDRFLLKSAGPDWASIVARYRFAGRQHNTPHDVFEENSVPKEAEPQQAVTTEPDSRYEATPFPEDVPQMQTLQPPAGPAAHDTAPTRQADTADSCPRGIREEPVDPFPGSFPGSEWTKISYPGPAGWWHYILGRAYIDGREADVIGVPGEYGITPPAWLEGFSTWMRCASADAHGYWLMFQDVQTGRVLDTARSRHGG